MADKYSGEVSLKSEKKEYILIYSGAFRMFDKKKDLNAFISNKSFDNVKFYSDLTSVSMKTLGIDAIIIEGKTLIPSQKEVVKEVQIKSKERFI